MGGFSDPEGDRTVVVNLQDFASFARDVESPGRFLAAAAHATLFSVGTEVHVVISGKHKQRAQHGSGPDSSEHELSAMIAKMDRKIQSFDASLEKILSTKDSDHTSTSG